MTVQIEVEGKTVSVSKAVQMVVENDDCLDVELASDESHLVVRWNYDNSEPAVIGCKLVRTYHWGERAIFTVSLDAEF